MGITELNAENGDVGEHFHHFVTTSTQDEQRIAEFERISAEYEKMARAVEASGIPQRRADIILELINGPVKRRTYAQVGKMLGGISAARVGQILKAARKRALRQEAQRDA